MSWRAGLGRTIPSYRIVLETEIKRWKGFLKALRASDRSDFEEMMNHCRRYASASGSATRPIVTDAMFMSILLAHEKSLRKIKETIDETKNLHGK